MRTVAASIPVLRWAAERSRLADDKLLSRFPKWHLWLEGEAQPTLKQLEDVANVTHTPFGYFFLPKPPSLMLPVPDFRTVRDEALAEPSSNLLDTIYLCQQRQDWYRDHARLHGLPVLQFVGNASTEEEPEVVAGRMRDQLGISTDARRRTPTWTDALRQLTGNAEEIGVMVMVSSVVGSNSHRKLNVNEFRGFTLADDRAPLVFINGGDSKAAQMLTMVHELAHVWLGTSGVSDTQAGRIPGQRIEQWCNRVAAEVLMPLADLREVHQTRTPIPDEIQRLARDFKVSTLVALRQLFDAGFIDRDVLWQQYHEEQDRLRGLEENASSGGDFCRSLGARTSKRFASAIIASTLEGLTSFPEAFRMLGMRKNATFYEAARELGVMV